MNFYIVREESFKGGGYSLTNFLPKKYFTNRWEFVYYPSNGGRFHETLRKDKIKEQFDIDPDFILPQSVYCLTDYQTISIDQCETL